MCMEHENRHPVSTLIDIVDYPTLVLSQLNWQRKNCQFCDASVITKDGKVFYAHKAILAASSSYFETTIALLEGKNSVQENKVVLQLGMVSSSVFECLLNVIYTSKLNLSNLCVTEIEAAANWLKLPQVGSICHKYKNMHNLSTSQSVVMKNFPVFDEKLVDQQRFNNGIPEADKDTTCKTYFTTILKECEVSEKINRSTSPSPIDTNSEDKHVGKKKNNKCLENTLVRNEQLKVASKGGETINSKQLSSKNISSNEIIFPRSSAKHEILQKPLSPQTTVYRHASPFGLFPHSFMVPFHSPVLLHKTSGPASISSFYSHTACTDTIQRNYSVPCQTYGHFSHGLPVLPMCLQQVENPPQKSNRESLSPTPCDRRIEKQSTILFPNQESGSKLFEEATSSTTTTKTVVVHNNNVDNTPKSDKSKVISRRTYQCKNCNSNFPSRAGLSVHMRSHTGERPYHCNVCGKAFTQLGHVQRHQKVHTGEKPFQCNWCHARVRDKASMHYHILAHKGIKPFQCDQCEAKFTKRSSLVKHKNVHTGEFLYQCSQCQASFREKASLSRHRRCQHSSTEDQPANCGDSKH